MPPQTEGTVAVQEVVAVIVLAAVFVASEAIRLVRRTSRSRSSIVTATRSDLRSGIFTPLSSRLPFPQVCLPWVGCLVLVVALWVGLI
jgi:hypothetical protein